MHNSIQIIGNLGRDPEQRVASKWHPVHGLVRGHATCLEERSRRVAVEDRLAPCRLLQSHERRSTAPRTGDRVLVTGLLLSSRYKREIGKSKKSTSIKLTSWQIRANIIRKLNRTAKEPPAVTSGSERESRDIPF
jgi:single-stranded DNA-binding protein